MSSKALKWIVPACILALILLGMVAWQIIGKRMATQAELAVQQTLQRFGFEDKVRWKEVSVSPFGTLTFNHLRIELSSDEYLNARQVRISDVIDEADRQRVRVQIKQAKSEFYDISSKELPAEFFNPMDANLQVDLNYSDNQAKILYDIQQEGMADIELQLGLSEIGALRGVLVAILPQSSKPAPDLDPNVIGLNRLAAAYSISVDSFEGKINNKGFVKYATDALMQEMAKGRRNMEQVRAQVFPQFVQEAQAACHNGIDSLKPSCQNLADFVLGKKNSLHLTASPAKPVSIEQLADASSALQLLNINIQ